MAPTLTSRLRDSVSSAIVIFVRLPAWALYALLNGYPRRSWSLKRTVLVQLVKSHLSGFSKYVVGFVAGPWFIASDNESLSGTLTSIQITSPLQEGAESRAFGYRPLRT